MKQERNVEIDCLRAIAVIVTVMAHMRLLFLWNPEWLTNIFRYAVFGNGVDLFFVISGFVITRSVRGKFQDPLNFHGDYKVFIVRRFWRLAPAAMFFCLFYLIYSLVSRSGEVGSFLLNLKNTVAVITMTANLRDQSNLMAVYWTLASEWQFYFVFPLVLFFANKRMDRACYAMLLMLAGIFFFAGATKFVQLRFECMMYGVLLGLAFEHKAYKIYEPTFLKRRLISVAVSSLSVFLLVFLPIALAGIPISILMGLVSLNCAFLVWISTYDQNYVFGGFFKRSLRYIGIRSYSIYLTHGPALYLTHDLWYWLHDKTDKQIGSNYTLRYAVTFLTLTWLLSELSYRFLERPFTDRSKATDRLQKEVRSETSVAATSATGGRAATAPLGGAPGAVAAQA